MQRVQCTCSLDLQMGEGIFDTELFNLTSKVLLANPEYYTIWNHRRKLIQRQIDNVKNEGYTDGEAVDRGTSQESIGQKIMTAEILGTEEQANASILNIIQSDLSFLLPLLRKFPKCYWLWNYRLWLLSLANSTLPSSISCVLWQQEFALVGKMLTLDSRNFHGWGYRRTVVANLEKGQAITEKKSMAEQEFDYTTKMVNNNLSNFSAWHHRSKVIPTMLEERQASGQERKELLNADLEMVQRALWADAEDQSLWFYHQALACAFSAEQRYSSQSIAPALTVEEKLRYLQAEIENLIDMLDGADNCKWIYQRLVELCIMYREQSDSWGEGVDVKRILAWVDQLKNLDPLRLGRWRDMESMLRDKYGS